MNCRLAIVIPAFKSLYFIEALESIERQTCKDFTLYIGDDASPGNLEDISKRFAKKINIVYHRFDKNIGLIDLAKQWDRCIELSSDEEYIWLFSDDDIMPENAVELFYKAIENNRGFEIFRFNIRQIDSIGSFISESTSHPEIEPAENFIYRRLKGETLSAACEYIFSRKGYKKSGGFVHFPLAWGSDDASWSLFGKQSGIYTIKGEPVLWRISDTNISKPGKGKAEKFKATLLFNKWIKQQNISDRVLKALPYSLKRQSIILNINLWMFLNHIVEIYKLIGLLETFKLMAYMVRRELKFR
jgi:glycosyltransferase involved in cell wall biosynthesis